jgi:hypothetical protein
MKATLGYAEHTSYLKEQIRELQKKSAAEEPLLQVGIAVHLRFLEQNRTVAAGSARGKTNQLTLRDGNDVAHNGNGSADVALFNLGIARETEDSAKLSEGLYKITLRLYLEWPELLRRVAESIVTMRIFKKLSRGNKTNALRAKHREIEEQLVTSWISECRMTENPVKFQQSIGNWLKLDKFEWLTSEIVEFDSKENPRSKPLTLVGFSPRKSRHETELGHRYQPSEQIWVKLIMATKTRVSKMIIESIRVTLRR